LIARLLVGAIVRVRAANKYAGQAVQAGFLRKVPDGGQMVYQLTEEAKS
jgi:predicted transcriptional regulator